MASSTVPMAAVAATASAAVVAAFNQSRLVEFNASAQIYWRMRGECIPSDQPPIFDPIRVPVVTAVFVLLYVLVFSAGVIGNAAIVLLTVTHVHLQTVQNIFIVNLALSDLLVCLISLPLTLVTNIQKWWAFGSVLCHLLPLTQGVGSFVSTLSLSAIAIDRFRSVTRPLSTSTGGASRRRAVVAASLLWLSALVVCLPYGWFMEVRLEPTSCQSYCADQWPSAETQKLYAWLVLCGQFVLPFTTMAICYYAIFARLRKRQHTRLRRLNERVRLLAHPAVHSKPATATPLLAAGEAQPQQANGGATVVESGSGWTLHLSQQQQQQQHQQSPSATDSPSANNNYSGEDAVAESRRLLLLAQQRRTTIILVSMVLCFGLTWLPYNLFFLVLDHAGDVFLSKNEMGEPIADWTFFWSTVTHCWAMFNVCCNPVLYAFLCPSFKDIIISRLATLRNYSRRLRETGPHHRRRHQGRTASTTSRRTITARQRPKELIAPRQSNDAENSRVPIHRTADGGGGGLSVCSVLVTTTSSTVTSK